MFQHASAQGRIQRGAGGAGSIQALQAVINNGNLLHKPGAKQGDKLHKSLVNRLRRMEETRHQGGFVFKIGINLGELLAAIRRHPYKGQGLFVDSPGISLQFIK